MEPVDESKYVIRMQSSSSNWTQSMEALAVFTKPGRLNLCILSSALPNHLNNNCKSMLIHKTSLKLCSTFLYIGPTLETFC